MEELAAVSPECGFAKILAIPVVNQDIDWEMYGGRKTTAQENQAKNRQDQDIDRCVFLLG